MQNNATIFESLFNRNFSDQGNLEFLKEITTAHPYFSPAQFFLLQKTNEGTGISEKQAVKTNILFNNPHWLNFQLLQTGPQVKNVEEVLKVEEAQEKARDIQPAEIKTAEPVNELPDDTDEVEEMEKEIEPMKIKLKMPEAQMVQKDEAMLFEPMHMVDYFASQGIKLTEEIQTADKLGKQLKSFTEWLKTMKKVHVETETASAPDNNIQTLAEKSNAEDEVLTASMADVLAKQGKIEKAREIFEKLSLLNPAKSTYFAAKIENLKGL